MKISIIGAGLGGLTFAALACKDGHEVTIYDKNSKAGGVVALLEHDGYKFEQGPLLVGDMLEEEPVYEFLKSLGYKHTEDFGVMNHKWNKPCFHAIAEIGLALERLGNIIQACLYQNGISTTIFDYQQMCDVVLVESITAESIAESMDWTTTLAQSYMDETNIRKKIVPFNTIPEINQAIKDNIISEKGVLLVSNRAFVMYCYDHRFFLSLNKKDWKSIDCLLTSKEGKILTSSTLSKVAHQLQKDGFFDEKVRYGK